MATTRRSTARTNRAKQSGRGGRSPVDRLNESLEAAQKALSDMQGDLGRGARDMIKNVSRLVRDARRDTAKLNRALVKDLGQLGQALTPVGNGASRTRRRTAGRSTNQRTRSSRTGARRTAAARKTTTQS
jgi:hypothetical protein